MSSAHEALRAEMERGRRTEVHIHWSNDIDVQQSFADIAPKCACGCGRIVKGTVEIVDGRPYVPRHAAMLGGAP